jgi:hypothetical protein
MPKRPDSIASVPYHYRNAEFVGGGFISGIIAHPGARGLFYARTDVGGAYRYDSERERWVPITDWIGQSDWRLTGVESIAVDPSDPDAVFLALGIYNRPELQPTAICRSFDRGESWQTAWLPIGMGGNEAGRGSGERLAVDPRGGSKLLFGSRDRGLFRSDDRGATWTHVAGFPLVETALDNATPGRWNYLTQAVGIVFVVFVPSERDGAATERVIAAVSTQQASLFESRDGGASWTPIAGQPLGLRPIRSALSSMGVLFITYGREPGPNTMFDGAVYAFDTATGRFENVTPLAPDPERGQTFGYAGVAVDAKDPRCVMVTTAYRGHAAGSGGDEVFRSLDSGRTWRAIGQSGRRDHSAAPWLAFGETEAHVGHWMYALVIDPFDGNRAWYATGQTIWGCANLGAVDRGERAQWSVCARGIEETVPLVLCSPPRGAAVFAGTGDISGFAVFDAGDRLEARPMFHPIFKDTTGIDFAESVPELVVRVGSRGWNKERDRERGAWSSDGGRRWSAFASYPSEAAFEGTVAVSADGARWLWAPRNEPPSVSTDRARSWRRPRGLDETPLCVLADRVNPRVFYALERQGPAGFRSRDGGLSFERLTAALPGARLFDACAAPAREGWLWAVLDARLYQSEDGAASWAPISTPGPVSHVGLGHATGSAAATLFVVARAGERDGFFRSADAGQSWQLINDDRHRFGQIRAIAGDPKHAGRFYLATGGRGVICGDDAGGGRNT